MIVENVYKLETSETVKGLQSVAKEAQKVEDITKKVGETSKTAFSGKDITDYKDKITNLNDELRKQKDIVKEIQTEEKRLSAEQKKTGKDHSQAIERVKHDLIVAQNEQKKLTDQIKNSEKAQRDFNKQHQEGTTIAEKGLDTFKKIGVTIIAAFATKAIIDFNKENVRLYLEAQKGEYMLKGALQGRQILTEKLIKYSIELQNKTGIGKETIINQLQFLSAMSLSEDMMKKVIQTAADMSARIPGMSFDMAVKGLATTLETGTVLKGISRYAGELKGLSKEAIMSGAAVEILGKKFKGAALELGATDFGKIEIFKNQIKELREEFGKSLGTPLLSGMKNDIKYLEGLNNVMKNAEKLDVNKFAVFINALYGQLPGGVINKDKIESTIERLKTLQKEEEKTANEVQKIAKREFITILGYRNTYDQISNEINRKSIEYERLNGKEKAKIYKEELFSQLLNYDNILNKQRKEDQAKQLELDKEFAKAKLQVEKETNTAIIEGQKAIRQSNMTELEKSLDDNKYYYDQLIKNAKKYGLEIDRLNKLQSEKEIIIKAGPLQKLPETTNPTVDDLTRDFLKGETLKVKTADANQKNIKKNELERNKEKNKELLQSEEYYEQQRKQIKQIGFDTATNLASAYYDRERILDDNAKQAEIRAAGNNQEKIKQINNKYAEKEKQRAADEARIQSYLAAVSALAQTTGGISVKILAAVAALALGEIYAQNIESQNVQQYVKGTKSVEGPYGTDVIPAKLTRKEAVIPVDKNLKYADAVSAIIDGKFNDQFMPKVEVNRLLIQAAMKRVSEKEDMKFANLIKFPESKEFSDYDLKIKINETNRILAIIAKQTKSKNNIIR